MLIRTWICLIEDIKVYLDVTFAVLYILNGGRERRIHGHFVILDMIFGIIRWLMFSYAVSKPGNKIPRCSSI